MALPSEAASGRRFAPGIRTKVLLASSALLLVPWIGYAFVAEMVRFLNEGQTRMLADSARAVAAVVQERAKVMMANAPGANDLAPVLAKPIELDGAIDGDWLAQGANVRGYGREQLVEAAGAWTPESLSFSHAIGRYATITTRSSRDRRRVMRKRQHVRASSSCDLSGEGDPSAICDAPVQGRCEPSARSPTLGMPGPGIEGGGATRARIRSTPASRGLPARIRSRLLPWRRGHGAVNVVIATESPAAPPQRHQPVMSDDVAAVLDAMAAPPTILYRRSQRPVSAAPDLQAPPCPTTNDGRDFAPLASSSARRADAIAPAGASGGGSRHSL